MLNMKSSVSTIWVYPYFMERQVRSCNPDLVMSDYRITYADHVQYGDTDQARKQGSPVRLVDLIFSRNSKFKLTSSIVRLSCNPDLVMSKL